MTTKTSIKGQGWQSSGLVKVYLDTELQNIVFQNRHTLTVSVEMHFLVKTIVEVLCEN